MLEAGDVPPKAAMFPGRGSSVLRHTTPARTSWAHQRRMRKEIEMRRALGLAVFLVLVLVFLAQAAHAGAGDYDLFLDEVELRPGVTSDIHVKVFVNDQQPWFGKTVFAIPGWLHTAQTWDQYAEALFTHPFRGVRTSRLVAIDLPGHGQSTLPTNFLFGQLLLDDYVTAILATLDGLRDQGIRPQQITGHSLGGLLTQMLQQRLVDSGSSLFREYGIVKALLLAPSAAAPVAQSGDNSGNQDLTVFLGYSDQLWYHFDIPASDWPGVFFVNWDGVISTDTPSPEDIEGRGYRAPGPLFSAMQTVGAEMPGLPYFPIPEVSPGIFGVQAGTLLHIVSYEDDTMIPVSKCTELFDHLICCPWWSRSTVIEAEGEVHDRVHDLHISNPNVIIDAMSEHGWFVW
jgi:pimeloyl-ACP methyl ester carboxylesterase